MKVRKGFVSNSSSSSFVLTTPPGGGVNFIEVEEDNLRKSILEFCLEETEDNFRYPDIYEKEEVEKRLEELKALLENDAPIYVTEFISDALDIYSDVYDMATSEYLHGGHGGPYDEDHFVELEESVWVLRDHYMGADEYEMARIGKMLVDTLRDHMEETGICPVCNEDHR